MAPRGRIRQKPLQCNIKKKTKVKQPTPYPKEMTAKLEKTLSTVYKQGPNTTPTQTMGVTIADASSTAEPPPVATNVGLN